MIARLRLLLGLAGLAAGCIDPPQPARYSDAAYLAPLGYLAYSIVLYGVSAGDSRLGARRIFDAAPWIDIGCYTLLMGGGDA